MSPVAVENCVAKLMADPEFKPKDPKQTKKEAAWAVCQSANESKGAAPAEEAEMAGMLKLEDYEGSGPVLVGAAVTNRPFMKNLPPMSFDADGKLIVPIFRKGLFKHPKGLLRFDDAFYQNVVHNFGANLIGMEISVDARHITDFGAVSWVKGIKQEGDLLVLLTDPTPAGKKLVEDKQFKYASAEFFRDFTNSERLSTDTLEEYDEEAAGRELAEIAKKLMSEVSMSDTITPALTPEVIALQNDLASTKSQLDELLSMKSDLERVNAELKAQAWRSDCRALLAEAESYRDSEQRAHSPMFLKAMEKVLLGEPVIEGAIKLEDNGANLRPYMKTVVSYLVKNVPGTVPTAVKLEQSTGEQKNPNLSIPTPSADEAKRFWN